jgi:uncharacterized membrane protein YbaN (DUF454 family)
MQPGLRKALHGSRRAGFMALGGLMLALGIIGAFLPVMPTTIFLILAAWFFGRSSPRLEAWMLNHPRFGLALRQWREQGAVPLRAKLMAVVGIASGYALFWFGSRPSPVTAALVALFMVGAAIYVVSRPEPDLRRETARGTEVTKRIE